MRIPAPSLVCSVAALGVVIGIVSCSSVGDGGSSTMRFSSRSSMAKTVLQSPKISLMTSHVSGKYDDATAYKNIQQAAWGGSSRRSSYGRAPGGWVHLDTRMLRAMEQLTREGFSFRVTEVAGGSHSSGSRHYAGIAFDVDKINGVKVGWANPFHRRFMRRCREMGATEVLGPGDRGHRTHLHLAWPRG